MKFCDQTPGIVKWGSEEFHIPYISPLDGVRHRYFPDFYVEVNKQGGLPQKFVIEVKPKAQTKMPKLGKRKTKRFLSEAATFAVNTAKWEAANNYCAERGWTFIVMTEDQLFSRLSA